MTETQNPAVVHPELRAEDLCAYCDLSELDFETTDQLETLQSIIGQDRALKAIEFGLRMRSFGYNLFVAGTPGTGKKTLIRLLVERIAKGEPTPDDILFVYNFDKPEKPKVIQVPPGRGREFRDDMDELIATLVEEIPKAFESEEFESRKAVYVQEFQARRGELLERIQNEANSRNLAVKSSGAQLLSVPLLDGRELTPEEFAGLPEEIQARFQKNQTELAEVIQEVYREIREVQQKTQGLLRDLDRTVALIASGHYIDAVRTKYEDSKKIRQYLKEVQADILDHVSDFRETGEEQPQGPLPATISGEEEPLKRYRVNLIVDNSSQKGAPVVTESHPTYRNLIGGAERQARMGTLYTDFTLLRAGSILAANRGYLILDLVDVLMYPLAWEALKRALQDGKVSIQDPSDQFGMAATAGLRPEPVEVKLKVIILGSSFHYNQLFAADEDFQKLFKIKADFDTVMKKDDGHILQYARFVKTLCDKEDLLPFEKDAVAVLIRHSSRMVSDKTRLTLRFSDVADLIRESDYWARQAGYRRVKSKNVRKAIEERIFRSNLYEEKTQEMIDEKSILIQTDGWEVGQVNGLSVYQVGDYAFGKPTRITAQVSLGDEGIVNIEREARMSGSIHDKGVLILSGYLHGKYGREKPINLHASICFEQSYSGVDGDSASSTEVYAILSGLTGVPIRQSIAVTGSINQMGVIQPIGGVNEKIEGFFNTCRAEGLTGAQGVIIPHQNVQNLMLKDEVSEAVRSGRFHIWAIEKIDQGLEILTGRSAGTPDENGNYPEDSLHGLAQRKLNEMADIVRQYKSG